VAGCGHAGYEDWLARDQRWREWLPEAGGRYQWQAVYRPGDGRTPHALDWRSPSHWVDLAAHESWPWFRDRLNGCAGGLCGSRPEIRPFFPAAASVLVPATIRYLAGFLHLFFTLAGASPEATIVTGLAGQLAPRGQKPSEASCRRLKVPRRAIHGLDQGHGAGRDRKDSG
jgi:hypothetical protein